MNIFKQHNRNIQILVSAKTAHLRSEIAHHAKMIKMCEDAIIVANHKRT